MSKLSGDNFILFDVRLVVQLDQPCDILLHISFTYTQNFLRISHSSIRTVSRRSEIHTTVSKYYNQEFHISDLNTYLTLKYPSTTMVMKMLIRMKDTNSVNRNTITGAQTLSASRILLKSNLSEMTSFCVTFLLKM